MLVLFWFHLRLDSLSLMGVWTLGAVLFHFCVVKLSEKQKNTPIIQKKTKPKMKAVK